MLFDKGQEIKSFQRINTLPFRSHYIPFKSGQDFAFVHGIIDKRKSEEFISLNGEWLIKEHKSLNDLKDIEEELKEKIVVPSCVQFFGYDYFQYTNFIYPFPFNPPHVPLDNPTYHYRKVINLKKVDNYYICFEGVDSAFYLYINNQYVGYSQISHSKSEFHITDYLADGDNVIDVVVVKWCASSYLEDQDKFRFTGIFRDVYILNRPKKHVTDFKIEPLFDREKWFIKITNLSDIIFDISLLDLELSIEPGCSKDIQVNNPIIWDDKNPYLYDVIISANGEKILQRVGLRKVEIKDGVFLINGKHQKLRGVNRHESHPDKGATVSIEDTLNDLQLIKSINANAIRTSHYPDIPEFYDLCDSLGIYVVDEADVETHGAVGEKYELQKWQDFANSGICDHGVLDREISLYERDKNHPSVIIWSLGNESNFGKMFYEGADYIHKHDARPIHYEGIFNLVDKSDYYTNRIDINSRMYPQLKDLDNYLKDKNEHRPLMICEYTHSMGNSCGDVSNYWKIINSSDRFIGAFVWEWCDHAIRVNGELKYGSDFPNYHNDGNFCVDGLVTPDREFKSNTLEVRAVYSGKLTRSKSNRKHLRIKELPTNNPINVVFNDKYAGIDSIINFDKELLQEPLRIQVIRAYTDNDIPERYRLKVFEPAKLVVNKVEKTKNSRTYFASIVNEKPLIDLIIKYALLEHAINIEIKYNVLTKVKPLRVGFTFATKEINEVEYQGYGPEESYIDKSIHSSFGIYTFDPNNNYGNYLKPQESGSRYRSTYIKTQTCDINACDYFSFNVLPYSTKKLMETKHNYELTDEGKTYFNIDLFMSGVGSHSCGPLLANKYSCPKHGKNTFQITIK